MATLKSDLILLCILLAGFCLSAFSHLSHAAEPDCITGPVITQEIASECPLVDRPRFRLR